MPADESGTINTTEEISQLCTNLVVKLNVKCEISKVTRLFSDMERDDELRDGAMGIEGFKKWFNKNILEAHNATSSAPSLSVDKSKKRDEEEQARDDYVYESTERHNAFAAKVLEEIQCKVGLMFDNIVLGAGMLLVIALTIKIAQDTPDIMTEMASK